MNKSLYTIAISFLLIFTSGVVFAQKEIGNKKAEVKAIATVTTKSILLRWGVTTPTAWKYANKHGYFIERKTIIKNKIVLQQPVIKVLNDTPIKPKPMMEWKEFTEENINAAIAAQALYGEEFDVNMNEAGNGIISILNQAQALEQRFTFAYYAADQDYEVAKFSGLAFTDNTIVEGEKYLYTIKVAVPNQIKYKIKKGGVYIGTMDVKPLPKPQEFVGVFKDKTAMLTWNYALLKKYYTNYLIEKSEDGGKNFKSLEKTPITTLGERETNPSNRMMYVDSLFQNNKTYQYRIKGISPFGIQGPYSNIVSGKGVTPLVYNPFITDLAFKNDGTATLKWEFPDKGVSTLKQFELYQSDKPKGNYVLITPSISKNQRAIKLSNLNAINYYKIIAIGNDGSRRESFPRMVQPDDTTPPAVPVEISGVIDSIGVVRLQWKKNTEIDFLGYRVFRANLKKDEFTQITFKPIPTNYIVDTINIKTLNKKIFYKIQVLDKRYNPSSFSKILELKRPDIVPPTAPIFTSFESNGKEVKLNWVTSSSEDAKATLLYRKETESGADWKLIKEVPLPLNSFSDTNIVTGKKYLYTIITVDEAGLESEPIVPLRVTISDNLTKKAIQKFTASVNREEKYVQLSWKYDANEVVEYTLYKAEEEKKPTMYKVFNAPTNSFKDKQLLVNTKYTYLLQATFKSGAKSPIKNININY